MKAHPGFLDYRQVVIRVVVLSEYVTRGHVVVRGVVWPLGDCIVDAVSGGDQKIVLDNSRAAYELLVPALGPVEGGVPGKVGDVGPGPVDYQRVTYARRCDTTNCVIKNHS